MTDEAVAAFRERVWEFYREHGRHDLPWRVDPTPYNVFVSEIMLQQTQVSRVLVKYAEWLAAFADFEALAAANVSEVLRVWQGLGYNRRGLWLREAANTIAADYGGVLPRDPAELRKLKGVGVNTAGSVAAFAYNEPVVFIETNIRRVFIHEFFPEGLGGKSLPGERTPSVADTQLLPLIGEALDRERPREWYWALMDYGAHLAKTGPNPNRRSKHYAVQSKFEGSARQIRGEVLRRLLDGAKSEAAMGIDDERLARVLAELTREGFIDERNGVFCLRK